MPGDYDPGASAVQRAMDRRSVLRGLGIASGIALAGCSAGPSGGEQSPTTGAGVIQSTTFEGMDLVVGLREGHDLSRLNLIGPDGTLFSGTDVATGTTTARLQILEIAAGGQSKHYTPGTHELVAISDEETTSRSLALRPELSITDVRQYREGEDDGDYGKLVNTIENTGTAPTWIYSIVYQDAPYFAANNEPSEDPGVTLLDIPDERSDLPVYPGSSKEYVGSFPPILFDEDQQGQCKSKTFEFTVVAGTPLDDPLRQQVRVTTDGSKVSAGPTGQYTCDELSVDALGGSDGDDQ